MYGYTEEIDQLRTENAMLESNNLALRKTIDKLAQKAERLEREKRALEQQIKREAA